MDLLRSGISLRQLHYLVAVADAGSFSAAAEQTHVAQPALSRQIASLETEVGLRLLDRSRNGVALTEGGRRLYDMARTTLERLGSVEAELRASTTLPAGVVTVALPTSIASLLVAKVVRELALRYPGIVLRVEDGASLENGHSLEAALVDFGIVPAAEELVDVDYVPLVRERLLLVERRGASRRGSTTIAFDEVVKRKLIMPPRTFHTRRVVEDAAHIAHRVLDIAYEQWSVSTIVSLVRDGLGATITSSPAVEQFWVPGDVTARRIVGPEITRTISLARSSRRTLSVAAEAVYGVVRQFAMEAVRDGHWQGTPLCD